MIAPATALDTKSPRIAPTRDRAINGFASTGNRMLIHAGLIGPADPI
jgi:predicted Zn-dependent protease